MGFIEDSKAQAKKAVGTFITIACLIIAIISLIVLIVDRVGANNAKSAIENAVETGGKVLPENEGRLVLVSGKVTAGDDVTLNDPEFGVSVRSPYLERYAQVYREHIDSSDRKYWSWDWQKDNSARFYSSAKIGEFELSIEQVEKLSASMRYVSELKNSIAERYFLIVRDNIHYYYVPKNYDSFNPSDVKLYEGDGRVCFLTIDLSKPAEYTILAKQEGSKLTNFHIANSVDNDINYVYEGKKSISEILSLLDADMKKKDASSGLIIMAVGFGGTAILRILLKKRRSRR